MADQRNRKNVLVGAPDVKASGGLRLGDVVSTKENVPVAVDTDLTSKLNQFPAGYVSNDGITKTVDRQTEKIKDWNGDTVMVLTSEHSVTLKLTFLEAGNPALLKALYGEDNVDISGKTITVKENSDDLPHKSYDFSIKAGEGKKIRVFAPDGQITNIGDVKFVKNDVIRYEVEIECYSDEQSNKLYMLMEGVGEDTEPEAEMSEEDPDGGV